MEKDHTISELMRKYAELSGKLTACRAEQATLQQAMAAVRDVLHLYRPDIRLQAIAGTRPKHTKHYGEHARAALDILRTAEKPMTTRDLVVRILKDRGEPNPSDQAIRLLVPAIGQSMIAYKRKGMLSDGNCMPRRWEIIRS
jgi:hypothetical protein